MAGYGHIVVCVDDSVSAAHVLAAARQLRSPDGTITLLHAIAPPSFVMELAAGLGGGYIADSTPLFEVADQWLASLCEEHETHRVLSGAPAPTIAEWARGHGADVIIVARHRSPEHALTGSFSMRLVSLTECPVLLVDAGHPITTGEALAAG